MKSLAPIFMKNATPWMILTILMLGCNSTTDQQKLVKDSTNVSSETTKILKTDTLTEINTASIVLNVPILDTIINISDNFQLVIKPCDSVYINEDYLDNNILDSIGKHYSNRHLEALAIEKYLLNGISDFAKRDTNGLSLKLKNGQWKLLVIDKRTDEADHTYEQFFEEFGYYSVRVQWYEGNGYKLINYNNGAIIYLPGRPYFSPDGKYMVSVNSDLIAGYSENVIEMYENNNNNLKLIWRYSPRNFGPFLAKWVNNRDLILKWEFVDFKNNMESSNFFTTMEIKNSRK